MYAKFCLLQAYFCSLWRSSSAAACRRPRLLPNERAILGWAGGRRCPCGLKPVALRLKLTAIKPRNLPLWPKPPVALCPNPRYVCIEPYTRIYGPYIGFGRIGHIRRICGWGGGFVAGANISPTAISGFYFGVRAGRLPPVEKCRKRPFLGRFGRFFEICERRTLPPPTA